MRYNDKVIEDGLDKALAIAKYRVQILKSLKQALAEDDINRIKEYARKLCGLTYESSGIPEGIDLGTR